MKIDHHIASLLYDHDCVIITHFGGFVASYQPAQLNELQQAFYPPSKKIAFNASLKKNDGLLASHISANENILYAEACKVISEYAEECFRELGNGKKLNLDRIGILFYDAEKNIQFIPDPHQNFLKESYGLSLIHSPALNLAEEILPARHIDFRGRKKNKKFNWRIVELVPAAAIVALMFTFPVLTKNFNSEWSSLNPFTANTKTETPAASYKKPALKEKLNPAEVFYKPHPQKNISDFHEDSLNETPELKAETPVNNSPVLSNTINNSSSPPAINNPPATLQPPISVTAEPDKSTISKYHIIAGCFRIEENAAKLEADLQSKGFNAEILGKNEAGLTMVSVSSFNNLAEAKNALTEIQNKTNSEAWIFRMK